MSDVIVNEHGSFPVQELCGYVGQERPDLLRQAFDLWGDEFPTFRIVGDQGEKPARVMLWELYRKISGGKDWPNIAQAIGDCVSWGIRNAINATQCLPILNGEFYEWHDTFPPYFYGISRVQIGGTRLGLTDGSLGVWGSRGVLQYGALAADGEGVPPYSGSLARSWGRGSGPPANFITEGKKHLVKSSSLVPGWDACCDAVKNGYGVSVASNYGFQMNADSSGFMRAQGTWNHQMAILGVDTGGDGIPPHACVFNSWGDVHGQLRDLRDPTILWPKGTLRVRPETIDAMLKQGDSFVYSMFDGFPAQKLDRSHFDLW